MGVGFNPSNSIHPIYHKDKEDTCFMVDTKAEWNWRWIPPQFLHAGGNDIRRQTPDLTELKSSVYSASIQIKLLGSELIF